MILVDATNLHVGGGVQVASAFISDILRMRREPWALRRFAWLPDLRISASSEVIDNLIDHDGLNEVCLAHGRNNVRKSAPQVRFTVFGPRYRRSPAKHHIMGFADVTSLYPWPDHLPRRGHVRRRVRRVLSLRSFRQADTLVVETPVVRDRLVDLGFAESRIAVVPNSCHPVFMRHGLPQEPWKPPIGIPRLLYVARAYPHKNHEFLAQVVDAYRALAGGELQVLVTLTPEEWDQRSEAFRRNTFNLGKQPIDRLPAVYSNVDCVIFPSLLECFSATPLEAFAMGVPLVASDLDFVRGICGDAALYFDPKDPLDCARAIRSTITDEAATRGRVDFGRKIVATSPTSLDRTVAYLDLMSAAT